MRQLRAQMESRNRRPLLNAPDHLPRHARFLLQRIHRQPTRLPQLPQRPRQPLADALGVVMGRMLVGRGHGHALVEGHSENVVRALR